MIARHQDALTIMKGDHRGRLEAVSLETRRVAHSQPLQRVLGKQPERKSPSISIPSHWPVR